MSIEDEMRREMRNLGGNQNSLGEAANRWVTWQIITSIVGVAIFLFILLFFFLPMWNRFPGP